MSELELDGQSGPGFTLDAKTRCPARPCCYGGPIGESARWVCGNVKPVACPGSGRLGVNRVPATAITQATRSQSPTRGSW